MFGVLHYIGFQLRVDCGQRVLMVVSIVEIRLHAFDVVDLIVKCFLDFRLLFLTVSFLCC